MRRQPTPQHITWFLDLHRAGQLDLNPPYQRKSVWTSKDRRFFLDTIFRNYPTPPLFLHRDINNSGFATYHVVDGKQRLETVLAFANNQISIDGNFGDENLNGKKFNELAPEYRRKFWDYVLVADFIESIEGTNIEDVFDRVNRNSKNLQPQELRHAKFDGWFIKESELESEDRFWWDLKINTRAKEKRMKNVQFVSELLLVLLENSIFGFNQEHIDNMYAKYDELEDLEESFDEDEFREKKASVKEYIAAMNAHNNCVANYGKGASHFYSLWSLVALNQNRLPDAIELADRYANFMQLMETSVPAESGENAQLLLPDLIHFSYFMNSRGAATEGPQRNARLDALQTIL